MDLQSYFAYWATFITVGSFVIIDLIAATTNALNGALLSQRPDYYKSRQRRKCSPLGSRSTTDQRMGARSQAPASAGSVE